MKIKVKNNGSVLLIVIFVIAFMAALVMGIAQLNTEEIQLMRNHIASTEALAVAEAGLNDALAELRTDSSWIGPITAQAFAGGSYDVTLEGSLPEPNLVSTGTSSQGFVARLRADITVASSGPPYVIRIDSLRINE